MVDLASRPADSSTRQVVLARAEEMANRFAHLDTQLETLQRNVTSDTAPPRWPR
jgi:flagellar hook-associated protein 1